MLRRLSNLTTYSIQATDGDIGSIHDFFFDDQDWKVRYLVADTGSWLDGRRVLITPVALNGVLGQQDVFLIDLPKEQIKNAPPVDTDKPVSRQMEIELHEHYELLPYWGSPVGFAGDMGAAAPMIVAEQNRAEQETRQEIEESDPTLRSANEVVGYHLQSTDDEVGHVEDFLIDDADWTVRYMLIDTRNWLPGRKVLVSPDWISRVSWEESKVFVEMDRERIENSPDYDVAESVDRDYETSLFGYYGFPRYWSK